ncbi:hypothetical protein K523DRAFT_249130 [Schizophyllum commune Tattone D]|nr:hypothetical protein K525DRAFT_207301 [Schizophyllum commune Loenen D]KAI5826377.1 hypothetical protein K523DRAFT_249130 [Schizophyllum commune Tattone D]
MSHHDRSTPNIPRLPAQAQGPTTAAIMRLQPRQWAPSNNPYDSHSSPTSAPQSFVTDHIGAPALEPGDELARSSRHATHPFTLPPLSRDSCRADSSDPELSPLAMSFSPPSYDVHLAFVNEMPPEILAEIFVHTLPLGLYEAPLYPRSQPLLLSHVCRYWRDVAINLPSLWRQFFLLGCPGIYHHRQLELARLYVDRARGAGLLIRYADVEAYTVTARGRPVAQPPHILREHTFPEASNRCFCALDFLISHIAQVHTLELVVAHASSMRLSYIDPHSAMMLRKLSLELLEGGPGSQALSRLQKALPRLTEFNWQSFRGVCDLPPPMDLHWEQLVDIHIEDSLITYSAFLGLVANGQRLRSVSVHVCPDAQTSSPLQSRIHQSELSKLGIRGKDSLDAILGSIQLPSLRELSLNSLPNHDTAWPCNDPRILRAFIAATSVGLKVLELSPADMCSAADLMALLQLPQMATLTLLIVYGTLVQDTFFTRLDPRYGPPIAPDLETLIIDKCTTTDGIVADMIASRKQGHYPLKVLQIGFPGDQYGLHPKDASKFRSLKAEYGVHIWFSGRHAYDPK